MAAATLGRRGLNLTIAKQMFLIQKEQMGRFAVALCALALVAYLAVGHALHGASGAGMPMDGEGICLVLVVLGAAVTAAAVRPRAWRPRPRLAVVLPFPVLPAVRPQTLLGARASPRWLQRFLR